MTFERALSIIFELEGKPTDDPRDPGGATVCGISSVKNPAFDFKNVSCESDNVRKFYRLNYWNPLNLDTAPAALRLTLFDCAVNQGVDFATRALQRALGIKDDGKFGAATMNAMNAANLCSVSEAFAEARFQRYYKNKNWKIYGGGWSRRLVRVSVLSALS